MQVVLTGLGRTQLIAYSDGSRTLSVLPFLRVIVSRMTFVPVVERGIEGRHAIISRIFRYAPRASALHMGFMMNLHEVKQLSLDNGPEAVSEIARNA